MPGILRTSLFRDCKRGRAITMSELLNSTPAMTIFFWYFGLLLKAVVLNHFISYIKLIFIYSKHRKKYKLEREL